MGILDKKQDSKQDSRIKEDESPKPLRGEDLDKALQSTEQPERLVYPAKPKSSKTVRLTTFAISNWDLVALAILCICVFVLGYLVRCLQDNLTTDQIRLGLEAFIEIIIAVFFASSAFILKLLTSKGAVATRFTEKVSNFCQKIQNRKREIREDKISEWGVSIQNYKKK